MPGFTGSVTATGSGTSVQATALTSNLNDLIVVGVAIPSYQTYVTGVSDSAGNQYTLQSRTQQSGTPALTAEVWISQPSAQSTTNIITVTIHDTTSNWGFTAASYAGVASLDSAGPVSYVSGGTSTTANATAATGGELMVALLFTPSAPTLSSVSGGYLDVPGLSTGTYVHQDYLLLGTAGANSVQVTLNGSATNFLFALFAVTPLVPVPIARAYGFAKGSPAANNTVNLSVNAGESIYVFIGYDCTTGGTVSVSSVTGPGNVPFVKAGSTVHNTANTPFPAAEVYYIDNVAANTSYAVKVTMSAPSYFAFLAVVVSGADSLNSLDAWSSGSANNTYPTSDKVTSVAASDLVLALDCARLGTTSPGFFLSAGGFRGLAEGYSGTTVASDVHTYVYQTGGQRVGTYDAQLSGYPTNAPYSLLTVAVRPPPGWSTLPGKPYLTVSAVGYATSGALIMNAGSDFGPDTPGTTTSGIQEALTAAKNAGIMMVHLNSGLFKVSSKITWPAGWTGTLEGSGSTMSSTDYPGYQTDGSHVQAQAAMGGAGSLLKLDNGAVNTLHCNMRDIYWDAAGVNLATAVVDFTQKSEASIGTDIARCVFDAGSSTTPVSLIMDFNDDSILYHCSCKNGNNYPGLTPAFPGSLQWKSPLGGNKIVGGVYDGMALTFQNSTQIFVTCNTAWRVLAGSADHATLNMYGCYRNTSADPLPPAMPASGGPVAPVVQNDNATLRVLIDGGWFFIDKNVRAGVPPPNGDSFFASTGSSDVIAVSLKNCVLSTHAPMGTTNNLLSTNAANLLTDFDLNSVTILNDFSATVVVNSQPLGPGSSASIGYGVGRIVAENRRTQLSAAATGATYTPLYDCDLEISATVYVKSIGSAPTLATAIQVSYNDENSGSPTQYIPVLSAAAAAYAFSNVQYPINAVGVYTSPVIRIRAQAGTAVKILTPIGGTYPADSIYRFDSTIKVISSA
jgi:hypothetical protein